MIPISRPILGAEEEAAVIEVLRSGIIAMGPRTRRFEEAWAGYCGVRHAVMMANGTVALEAALHAVGVAEGDEVIVPSFTFNATASTVLRLGARPVFVDVREDDYCLDPDLVEAAITPRTKVLMPVHLYGLMADMAPLEAIAARHGMRIVEDAAQAHGATYRGRRAGSFGAVAMFSLYATKNLTTGEGGIVTTDDDGLAERLRLFRNHGMDRRYHHEHLGTNYRPTDIAAAIGLVQLGHLDERNARRGHNAARLNAGLRGYATPGIPAGREHVWHQYTVRFPGERDRVAAALEERGVGTMIYYPIPIHRQTYLQRLMPGAADLALPVTDRLADEVLSLPVRPDLTDAELDTVIAAVREVATQRSGSEVVR
jgi:dTDP-4-amino-4,6-dideoxygalactose transaminase